MARRFKKRIRESGIALMMVLGSVAILTSMVVEFAYNSHITYTMATNNLDRLKAFYLARSAMGFAKLHVKIEKDIRKQLQNYAKYLSGVIGSEPICRILPFSTELLRAGFGLPGREEVEMPEDVESPSEEEGEEPSSLEFEGILKAAAAGDFLSFDGNFTVTCDIEDRKMNLNYFRTLNPQDPVQKDTEVNAFESHKRLLESLLASAEFEDYFEDPAERREVVDNIADWVDANTQVDEAPGFQGGYENDRYSDAYMVKNGKLSTLGELLLVAGVGDDIFKQLLPNVTIYGDDKVNLCLAEDAMIKAFVVRYSNVSAEIDPILPDNDELLDNIVLEVRQVCLTPVPKANEVANAIRVAIGLGPEADPARRRSARKSVKKETEEEAEEAKKGKKATPVAKTLTEQIVTENRYYSFDLTGSAGDIILNIQAVMHTEDKDPNKWKLLYYRIQ